jgi:hypothetical protein
VHYFPLTDNINLILNHFSDGNTSHTKAPDAFANNTSLALVHILAANINHTLAHSEVDIIVIRLMILMVV